MNRIRELRKQKDMTQKKLAEYLEIADSTLSYWEMGKYEPDSEALIKLSRFFQVPIDYILCGDFQKWDTDGVGTIYLDPSTSSGTGFDMSVSESLTEYRLQSAQKAFQRVEFEDLTQGEIDLLAEYAVFIKSRRNRNKPSG